MADVSVEIKALGEELKKEALDSTEALAMKIIAKVPMALDIAAKAIPGVIDDVILASLKGPLQAALTQMAQQISK